MPLVLLVLVLAAPASGPARPPDRPERPRWVKEGIVMASNMEALSFVRRRGGQAADYAERLEREAGEEAIVALRAQGVNTVLVTLMKGAGFRAEAEDIGRARAYVALAHKHGLRVGGYVGGSIFYETLFAEEPDAADWVQRDQNGRPMHYTPAQTFRYMANRNHPGYREFVKRVLRLGIGDLKMDFVHFDQMMWWPLPQVASSDLDQALFRDYVRARYPPERMKLRFGYAEMGRLRIPEFGLSGSSIPWHEVLDPLMQELIRFRSFTLAERFREYDEYVHALNPEAALQANPHLDPSANNAAMYGVDVPELLAHGDLVSSEERNEPGYSSDGRLVSRIRTYKAGRVMGKPVIFWQQPATVVGRPPHHVLASEPRLRLAEAIAFCDNCIGFTAGMDVGGVRFPPEAARYLDFYWKRNELLAGAESAAEVALLRSFASVELNGAGVLPATVLFEQSLIQAQIPFDTIYDRHLDRLDRYRVLVLANQDALSQEQLDAIRTFVHNGGALVATDRSSLLTEWRLRRPGFGLADLLGVGEPPPAGGPGRPLRRTAGKGRVVYVPRVEPAVDPPPPALYYVFRNAFWKLPRNHADLVESVRWALDAPRLTVTAPDCVAVELTRQPRADRLLVHLVNYKVTPPVLDAGVRLRVPAGKRLRGVTAESPDAAGPLPLRFALEGEVASVRLPKLDVYSVLVFQLADR